MPRYKKCILCEEPIIESGDSKQIAIPYKGRYVHKTCFDLVVKGTTNDRQIRTEEKEKEKKAQSKAKTPKPKPIETVKEAMSEEEYKEKKAYYSYLREQGVDIQAKHYALTEKYIKQYAFTYSGMLNTLKYLNDVLEYTFDDENSNMVGLIPYHYEGAEAYYKSIEACGEANKDKDINKMYKIQTVKVKKEERKRGEVWDF